MVGRGIAIAGLGVASLLIALYPHVRTKPEMPALPAFISPLELHIALPSSLRRVDDAVPKATEWASSFQTLREFLDKRRFLSSQTEAELAKLRARDASEPARKTALVARLVEEDIRVFGTQVLEAQRELNASHTVNIRELNVFRKRANKIVDDAHAIVDSLCTLIGVAGTLIAIVLGFSVRRNSRDRVNVASVAIRKERFR